MRSSGSGFGGSSSSGGGGSYGGGFGGPGGDSMSPGFVSSTGHSVHMRGLPYSATEEHIMEVSESNRADATFLYRFIAYDTITIAGMTFFFKLLCPWIKSEKLGLTSLMKSL